MRSTMSRNFRWRGGGSKFRCIILCTEEVCNSLVFVTDKVEGCSWFERWLLLSIMFRVGTWRVLESVTVLEVLGGFVNLSCIDSVESCVKWDGCGGVVG